MRTREYARRAVQTDDKGFLLDGSQWTPDVGEEIAREVGVWPLTEEHWSVITFCREVAAREGRSPGVRRIAKDSGVDTKSLHRLFGNGAGTLAARIAGLPKVPSAAGSGQVPGKESSTRAPERGLFSLRRRTGTEKELERKGRTL